MNFYTSIMWSGHGNLIGPYSSKKLFKVSSKTSLLSQNFENEPSTADNILNTNSFEWTKPSLVFRLTNVASGLSE